MNENGSMMTSATRLRVLLLITDPIKAEALYTHFSSLDFECTVKSDALYALTALERDCPDLIVCDRDAGGMSGLELHEIVRSEPHLGGAVFVLLDLTARLPGTLDVVLPADATPDEIAGAARTLLVNLGRLEADAYEKGKVRSSSTGGDARLTGTFEVMSLFDLIVSLTHSRKSGDLCIQLAEAEAKVTIRAGRITHATYKGKVGEDALLLTFNAVEEDQGAEFVLRGLNATDQTISTINTPIDQLLLKVAVGMDHSKKDGQMLS
jgi:CheY-like chemotaxis protein